MTKKSNNPNPTPPQGGLKKGKIKRKQMFNELQTHQEQIIDQNQSENMDAIEEEGAEMMDQEYNPKVQKLEIGQEKSLQEVCEAVNQLMAKNKIGAKNAFDVPIIDLYDLINFRKSNVQVNRVAEEENTWKTLSSTFENDSKIYAYRVDAIHDIAYSILNIMSRRSSETEQKLRPELQKSIQQGIQSSEFSQLKDSFLANMETEKAFLEIDTSKINIPLIECSMTSDPALERTKRLFDEPGLKGMLLNSIPINNNLEMLLFSKADHEPYSMKLSEMNEVDIKSVEHPLKVFDSIEKIKTDINKILGVNDSKSVTNKQLEHIWNNVKKNNFTDWGEGSQKVWLDVQDPECRQNFDMMIDENSALFENTHRKFIGEFIKMKNNPQKKLMTNEEMERDGQRWLNDIDRKFLGLKGGNSIQKTEIVTKKLPRPFDDVDFEGDQIYELDEVLRKQSPTREIHEQIEDKWLMTIRPSHEFKMYFFYQKKLKDSDFTRRA